jgi:hypothetical protein
VTAGVVLRGRQTIVGLTVGENCGDTNRLNSFGAIAVGADGAPIASYGRRGAAVVGYPGPRYAPTRWPVCRAAAWRSWGASVTASETCLGRARGGTADLDRASLSTVPLVAGERAARSSAPAWTVRLGPRSPCREGACSSAATAPRRRVSSSPAIGRPSRPEGSSASSQRSRSPWAPLRAVRLRTILGRRGRLRLLVRRGGYASKARFRSVCLGTGGPGGRRRAVGRGA